MKGCNNQLCMYVGMYERNCKGNVFRQLHIYGCQLPVEEKPGFESQARHQNKIRKVFLRRYPLSRFLVKTLRVNKIAMKSFLKKNLSFGVDFKL